MYAGAQTAADRLSASADLRPYHAGTSRSLCVRSFKAGRSEGRALPGLALSEISQFPNFTCWGRSCLMRVWRSWPWEHESDAPAGPIEVYRWRMSWHPTRLDVVNWKMDVVIVRAVWPAVLALVVGQPSSVSPRKAWYFTCGA